MPHTAPHCRPLPNCRTLPRTPSQLPQQPHRCSHSVPRTLSHTLPYVHYRRTLHSTAAHRRTSAQYHTLAHCRAHCHTICRTAAHYHSICRNAAHYHYRTHALPLALPHTMLHCHTLPRALSHTAELPHTAAVMHPAMRTATHCRSYCRTLSQPPPM